MDNPTLAQTSMHAEFVERLSISDLAVFRVYMYFVSMGFLLNILQHEISPDHRSRWKYTDDGDIEIFLDDPTPHTAYRIEVKHRTTINFNSIDTYPFPDIILDEAYKVEKDHDRPLFAYAIVNADRTGMIIIPARSLPYWFVRTIHDNHYNDDRKFYTCAPSLGVYKELK